MGGAYLSHRSSPAPCADQHSRPHSEEADPMAITPNAKELTEVSEAQIAVHWKEEEYYQPSEQFKAQANMRDPRIFEKFGLDRFPDCFRAWDSRPATASPCICRWCPSSRSRCWRARAWASSTHRCSADSAVRRAAPVFKIPAAGS